MEIGTILKKTRTIYDMPAKKLAAELKISPSYLSEIENNKKAPSIELLEKYANIFNMKLSSLILLSENYEDDKQKNKSEMYIQRKMIELINKYSSRS
ncbi:helix-turn-helix domain-containing protein [Vagococcus fluvialis]|uniref:helix-turn-helix domain-containing protein n=1 Tax=Vagococcus fluvialis TaxID=2738 RepID=UPI0037B14D58